MVEFFVAALVVCLLWWWFSRKRRSPNRSRHYSPVGSARAVPGSLMKELDRLTKDRRVSERLIERIEFNNPGRSRRWCVEKAIYDIQRDRRS